MLAEKEKSFVHDGIPATLPLHRAVRVLKAHPAGLIAFEKPTGLLAHSNRGGDRKRALLQADYDREVQCYRWGANMVLYLVNRLDAPTSGIILGAFNPKVAAAAKAAFAHRDVYKRYHAIVAGKPPTTRAYWRDHLVTHRKGQKLRVAVCAGPKNKALGAKKAETKVEWIATVQEAVSLIALEPKTGRTHQLRVQCAQHRLPIVGDRTYGDFRLNRTLLPLVKSRRLFLHASRLQLTLTVERQTVGFSVDSSLPVEFERLRTLAGT